MESNEEFYQNLRKKLSNKKTLKTLDYHKRMIEELMDCAIDIQFISESELREMELMDQKLKDTLSEIHDLGLHESAPNDEFKALRLKDLKEMLTKENEDQKVFIDPIYLKSGMNPLHDMLLVGMDQYVILLPKSEKINNKTIN
jgi:hypothetical protein